MAENPCKETSREMRWQTLDMCVCTSLLLMIVVNKNISTIGSHLRFTNFIKSGLSKETEQMDGDVNCPHIHNIHICTYVNMHKWVHVCVHVHTYTGRKKDLIDWFYQYKNRRTTKAWNKIAWFGIYQGQNWKSRYRDSSQVQRSLGWFGCGVVLDGGVLSVTINIVLNWKTKSKDC